MRAATGLLPFLTGCKLLLGPPLRPGSWDLALTGMGVSEDCDPAETVYSGATQFGDITIKWPDMQEISVDEIGDEESFALGHRHRFDMEFDGVAGFDATGLQGAVVLSGGACEAGSAAARFELDDRESFTGTAILYGMFGAGCDVDRACEVWFELEGDWVDKN